MVAGADGLVDDPVPGHGDTQFDPPATSVVMRTFLIGVLAIANVLPSSWWVPTP